MTFGVLPLLIVAVLDTGLNLGDPRFQDVLCHKGHKNFTNESINDSHGHGTRMVKLIKENAGSESIGKYCIVVYKYYQQNTVGDDTSFMVKAIQATSGVDVVNISGGGASSDVMEYSFIRDHQDIKFIVAAGNDGQNINFFPYYPAAYPLHNIIAVGALHRNGEKRANSNHGKLDMAWELGEDEGVTGTSVATAIHTGKYIKKLLGKR